MLWWWFYFGSCIIYIAVFMRYDDDEADALYAILRYCAAVRYDSDMMLI